MHRPGWWATCLLAYGVSACAQTPAAILTGTVMDPAGATVPGAKVTLSSTDTGLIRSFLTQESGQYVFPLLPPGRYQLRVERHEFKLYLRSDIYVGAGQAARLNPTLEIGADPQVMVVQDNSAIVDAAPGLNLSLRGDALHDMPMDGRNFLNLAGAAPGVSGRGSVADFDNFAPEKEFDFSANGRGSAGNLFLLDGLSITSNIVAGVANISPNPDSIQEYTILTNTFSAEQGTASSLQVSMSTRAGTNDWHGSGSYFFSNQNMAARTVFTDRYDPFKKHNVAGTLSGPIQKNGTFFFTSFEMLRSSQSLMNSLRTFESPEFVAWARSAFPGSTGTRVLSEAPVINVGTIGTAATARDILGTKCGIPETRMIPCDLPVIDIGENRPTSARNGLQYSLRLDRQFRNGRERIFGTYYRTTLDLENPVVRKGTGNTDSYGSRVAEASWIHTFSSSLLNEATFGALKVSGDDVPEARYHIPEINIAGQNTNISPGWGGAYAQRHYNWRDVITWVRGRHLLKAGANAYWSDDWADFTRSSTRPVFQFTNLLDLVQDRPFSETGLGYNPITGSPEPFVFGGEATTLGLFVQDEWTVAPNLNVTLGMRWDKFGNPAGSEGLRFTSLTYGPAKDLDGRIADAYLRTADHAYARPLDRNISPRLGFAWSPRGDGSWRVHGGVGVYQDWIPLGQSVDLLRPNPPNWVFPTFRADGAVKPVFSMGISDTYPFGFVLPQLPGSPFDERGGLVGFRPNIGFMAPDLSAPYSVSYLTGVERSFGGRLLAGIRYSGAYTPNALLGTDLNRKAGDLLDGTLDRLNPSFGSMSGVWNGNVIRYNALIVTARGEAADRYLFQASYTFSKTTDYVQAGTRQNRDAPFEIPDQHRISAMQSYADWDVRHRFALSGLWHIPGPRLWAPLFSGWEASTVAVIQSGTPFTVVNRSPFDPIRGANGNVIGLYPDSGDYNADGLNYDLPNAPAQDFSGSHTRRQFLTGIFGKADFPVPAPGVQGNIGRNIYRNPGLLNVDAGLIKNSSPSILGERGRLQLRLEFFNVLNRVNLQAVDNNLGSVTFGRSIAAYAARSAQAGVRILF